MANQYQHLYEQALESAGLMLDCCPDLEPTSALKQAANDCGVPYGDEMGAFVDWANRQWFGEEV